MWFAEKQDEQRVVDLKIDTVEVWGSSPHVPTISFNGLTFLASFREAPNGSIKGTELGRVFHFSSKPTSGRRRLEPILGRNFRIARQNEAAGAADATAWVRSAVVAFTVR